MKEDFYAVSFIANTHRVAKEYEVSPLQQGRNFYACLWIFGVQIVIIAMIFKQVAFEVEVFKIYTPHIEVYICRFICTILLHFELIEDVKQGLNMLWYLNTHPEEFIEAQMPFLIAMMQTVGGFLAEITNLFMLSTRTSVEFCISFFVAFHVLTAIDNIYAEGVCDFALLSAIEEPLHFKKKPRQIPYKDRNRMNKGVYVVLVCVQFLYNSVYYYYLPFVINFIPYFFTGDPAHMPVTGH